ncbi:MAG: chemotaxis protein [Geminicoccaceae bacterium]|nr:MAG: chemotaxis protein [Geminicoccaceae bacterium]
MLPGDAPMNDALTLPASPNPAAADDTAPSHVVAIGASAGGLEPIEMLFAQIPGTTGAAFVLIQHLSPDFKSLMDQLLGRRTSMPIIRVTEPTRVERNKVYLIPPRKEMTITGGELRVHDRDEEGPLHLPIDTFLRSLAVSYGERAVAVILSGSGSDGARGAAAVRDAGGLVIAQEPSTANFPSMPQAVLEQRGATIAAGPGEIGSLVAKHVAGTSLLQSKTEDVAHILEPKARIFLALRQRFGPDFGYYKQATVARRIERRVGLTKCTSTQAYADYIQAHPEELEALYHDILIGVTSFFRDEAAFRCFEQEALPVLLDRMAGGEQVRVWSAGCATGEEAYSLAILLVEGAEARGISPNLKVFATDVHERSLAEASEGIYGAEKLQGVAGSRIDRCFDTLSDGSFRIKPSIRRFIVFSRHNLIKDPPFSRLHLISCRNLMIYLGDAAQRKVVALFHFSLRRSGFLFLGSSETPGRLADEFATVSARYRLFKKLRDVRLPAALDLLPPSHETSLERVRADTSPLAYGPLTGSAAAFRSLMPAYDVLLEAYAPPGLLVDLRGEIVHVFGDAARFIKPLAEGAVVLRATDRVSEPLRVAVSSGLERALKRSHHSLAKEIPIPLPHGGGTEHVTVRIRPIHTDRAERATHAFIAFETVRERPAETQPASSHPSVLIAANEAARRIQELETDLRLTEESLQTTIEELETSNEELQASNEELQSSNEELQSTNEELYSINEELHTVSGEYEQRIEELVRLNADINNLLTSTDIGAIFLDRELNLRRFTPAAAKLFNLVPHDVGRPISHVTSRIVSDDLQIDIAAIQAGQKRIEREVTTDMGGHYLVRLLPYTTADGHPDGVSLSFVDVVELKRAHAALERRNTELALANEELERFAYIASHDLKAPVRGCSHVLAFLKDDIGHLLDDAQNAQLTTAMTRLRQMETMLRELLDFAKLNQEEATGEPIDVAKLLGEVVTILEPPAGFDIQLQEPFPAIKNAPGLVSLVFRNLIGNAIKHHHEAKGRIVVRGEAKPDRAEFFVSDDGPGIDRAMHEQIFEPFRKLDSRTSGTGMGLAFVKRALERAQGQIDIIASGPGRGTTFRVVLPLEPAATGNRS